jgi:mRNA interferase MazF
MKRGQVYYIDIPYATGHEMVKARPGVIVSDGHFNASRPLQVVFCSASTRGESPEHILLHSLPEPSYALCEHIYTVDFSRISTYLGEVTAEELGRIDDGLAFTLGLAGAVGFNADPVEAPAAPCGANTAALEAELNVYKKLYNDLLNRVAGGYRE